MPGVSALFVSLSLGFVFTGQSVPAKKARPPRSSVRNPLLARVLGDLGSSVRLRPAEQTLMRQVVTALKGKDDKTAKAAWEKLCRSRGRALETDLNALLSQVMRQAYLDANKDLKDLADKVAETNRAKQKLRGSMSELRDTIQAETSKGASESKVVSFAAPKVQRSGQMRRVVMERPKSLPLSKWKAELRNWEGELKDMGDMNQMLQMDLQRRMQEMAQLMETFSAILKAFHDTATAIIQNLK